jgi:hypothetical protein
MSIWPRDYDGPVWPRDDMDEPVEETGARRCKFCGYREDQHYGFDRRCPAGKPDENGRETMGVPTSPRLATSEEWQKECEAWLVVMDPDGWDRTHGQEAFDRSWGERITKQEFASRTARSTCIWTDLAAFTRWTEEDE